MKPFDVLRRYLLDRAPFSDSDLERIEPYFLPRHLAKGSFLQRAGEAIRYAAFVAHGCLRCFVIDAQGKEHILQFAPETWWVSDIVALTSGSPATLFVEALEDSELLLLDRPSQKALLEAFPLYAAAYQAGVQKHIASKDTRILQTLSASAEERYLGFLATYPSIARRVPQRMLASYLGITPEALSRVRRSIAKKKTQASGASRPAR